MKRILSVLFAVVVSLSTVEAQKAAATKPAPAKQSTTSAKLAETPQEKAKEMVAKIDAACKLKPEQASKLNSVYTDYYTKHDALKKQKNILDKGTYDDRSATMKKSRDTAIKSVLSAGQYKLWSTAKDKEKKEAKKEKQEE